VAVRDGPPPVFAVDPGHGRFYALEVAAIPPLFNDAAGRKPDTFYATWQDHATLLSAPEVQLPAAAWQRLGQRDLLFYRILTSVSAGQWRDARDSVRTTDIWSAPVLVVAPEALQLDDPPTLLLARVGRPAGASGPGGGTDVQVRFVTVDSQRYRTVTIMPGRVVVEVEDVP
jgi:hypothetical protein